MCDVGSWSSGGSFDPCVPCPFGFTSLPASTAPSACRALSSACPPGTSAPADAVSAAECLCKAGFGAAPNAKPGDSCILCLAGTYSPGGSMDICFSCSFGKTSAIGSDSADDCYDKATSCPSGMQAPPNATSADQCVCKPGFGGEFLLGQPWPTQPPASLGPCSPLLHSWSVHAGHSCGCNTCSPCEVGFWSPGGSRDPCVACGFGLTSPPAASSQAQCVPGRACPAGQIAPPNAVSEQQCTCRPGFGAVPGAPCMLACKRGAAALGLLLLHLACCAGMGCADCC